MDAIITRTDAQPRDLVDTSTGVSQAIPSLSRVLLDPCCALCGDVGVAVCPGCLAAAGPPPVLPAPLHVDRCSAVLDYHRARPLLTSLKNGHRRDVIAVLADLMAAGPPPPTGAMITWAPTTTGRRRQRGFDQA
jgi:predicted amidophosphoribosyltransferase